MSKYEEMKSLLEVQPAARERKQKARAVRHFLIKRYPELKEIPIERLMSILTEASNYDRAWRKVTEENITLRGTDYDKKRELMDRKKAELGYTSQ